jgi:hypothetical protein
VVPEATQIASRRECFASNSRPGPHDLRRLLASGSPTLDGFRDVPCAWAETLIQSVVYFLIMIRKGVLCTSPSWDLDVLIQPYSHAPPICSRSKSVLQRSRLQMRLPLDPASQMRRIVTWVFQPVYWLYSLPLVQASLSSLSTSSTGYYLMKHI